MYRDRVKDTTITTGTAALVLEGDAPAGYQTFAAAFGASSQPVAYCVAEDGGPIWEVGVGTFNGTTGITRSAAGVIAGSSGPGVLVTLPAGAKDVFCTAPASYLLPPGANAQVPFNDVGVPGASANFTYNKVTNTVTFGNLNGSALAMTIQPKAPTVLENGGTLTLQGQSATAAARAGGQVIISGGNGQTTASGGNVSISAGNTGSGSAGSVRVTAGSVALGNGGDINFNGGNGTAKGGNILFVGGQASTGAGGQVILYGGQGITFGGAFILEGGFGNVGGPLSIRGGAGDSGSGGSADITGGVGATGGGASLRGGDGASGNAGSVVIEGGICAPGSIPGSVTISGRGGGDDGFTPTDGGGVSINSAAGVNGGNDGEIILATPLGTVFRVKDDLSVNQFAFHGATPVAQSTGWGSPTGTATKTAFATSTVTTAQLAERVKAIIDYLKLRGDFSA